MTHVANVPLEAPAVHLWGNVSSHWLKEVRDQLGPDNCDIHIHAPGTQVEFASLSRATYYYVNRLDCAERLETARRQAAGRRRRSRSRSGPGCLRARGSVATSFATNGPAEAEARFQRAVEEAEAEADSEAVIEEAVAAVECHGSEEALE